MSDKNSESLSKPGHSLIKGVLLISLAIFMTFSFLIPGMGVLGMFLKKSACFLTGHASGFIPLIFLICGIQLLVNGNLKLTHRNRGILMFFVLICFFLQSLSSSAVTWSNYFSLVWNTALNGQGGGLIGGAGYYFIALLFGKPGFYILEIILFFVSASFINRQYVDKVLGVLWRTCKKIGFYCKHLFLDFFFESTDPTESQTSKKAKKVKTEKFDLKRKKNKDNEASLEKQMPFIFNFEEAMAQQQSLREETSDLQETKDLECSTENQTPVFSETSPAYQLPPYNLLIPQQKPADELRRQEAAAKTRILEETFRSFGIEAKVSAISIGPAITRYEIQPPPGIKVSRIMGLADDLSLNLAVAGIRIEAPIPGKAAMGIEVPNNTISPVTLQELVECKRFNNSASKLTVILGRDIAGSPITADLDKMPHLLIAGSTGSGKSVCINTLICSILFRSTSNEVKFLMIDPKMVELSVYSAIPHLISPVVTDAKKAAGILHWAVLEMERRYQLFAQSGVKDMERYNKNIAAADPEVEALPFIVIIIDELADLMMVASREVEDSICRLAQMARAAGMHLVVATQRPSVDVITGLIKANIPSRISFAVSSQMDSRTILDMSGAEKLLGRGDMLFAPAGASKPVRVQGAYLSDQEVENLVDFLKKQSQPVYNEEILNTPLPFSSGKDLSGEGNDELLGKAVRLFLESNTVSISLLQRRLHIGYARAARLVDIMEQRGIVGHFEDSKPRAILMTLEEFQQAFPDL